MSSSFFMPSTKGCAPRILVIHSRVVREVQVQTDVSLCFDNPDWDVTETSPLEQRGVIRYQDPQRMNGDSRGQVACVDSCVAEEVVRVPCFAAIDGIMSET